MRCVMNACGHERHDRPDVHDCVFLICQREHVCENGRGRVHGYEPSQNRDDVGEYAGADVCASLSWCLRYLTVRIDCPPNPDEAYHPGLSVSN